jgi:hypothetical protein
MQLRLHYNEGGGYKRTGGARSLELGISCWECLILHRICVVYSGHGPLGDLS